MRPQTKGAGSTDIFRVNAPKILHYTGAGMHWRDNSDYTALGPTPRPDPLLRDTEGDCPQ